VRPFFSDKFDITKYPKYKYLSDAVPKNAFDTEKHIKRRPAIVKPEEEFDYYEIDGADLQEDTKNELERQRPQSLRQAAPGFPALSGGRGTCRRTGI
jgi:type IV secretion system protein VirD4